MGLDLCGRQAGRKPRAFGKPENDRCVAVFCQPVRSWAHQSGRLAALAPRPRSRNKPRHRCWLRRGTRSSGTTAPRTWPGPAGSSGVFGSQKHRRAAFAWARALRKPAITWWWAATIGMPVRPRAKRADSGRPAPYSLARTAARLSADWPRNKRRDAQGEIVAFAP